MRHVEPPDEPASLRSKATLDERAAALRFFAVAENAEKPFRTFRAYGRDEVRVVLNEAFHFKCAYCESSYGATQPVAIEHYRPKGKVKVEAVQPDGSTVLKDSRPGYYWLASEWVNLLPSCTDCNSPRRQELPLNGRRTAGKANRFPVADESTRARGPGDETKEQRLLLHPYLDDPPIHLHFVDRPDSLTDGEIEPALNGPSRRPSLQGAASIEVYALQRRGLIDARKAMLIRVRAALVDVEDDLDELNEQGPSPRLMARFQRHVQEFKSFAQADNPYSMMCQQIIDTAFHKLFGGSPP